MLRIIQLSKTQFADIFKYKLFKWIFLPQQLHNIAIYLIAMYCWMARRLAISQRDQMQQRPYFSMKTI